MNSAARRAARPGEALEPLAELSQQLSEREWQVLQLIVRTSTDLPPDVRAAMKHAVAAEPEGTRAAQALNIIAQNIDLAVDQEGAICQDTGMPTFEVKTPVGANQIWMRQQIRDAVAEATRRGKLRPNSVDSIDGTNSGNNLGPGTPIIHFDQWARDEIEQVEAAR